MAFESTEDEMRVILLFSRGSNQGNLGGGMLGGISRKPLCGRERLGHVGATDSHVPVFLRASAEVGSFSCLDQLSFSCPASSSQGVGSPPVSAPHSHLPPVEGVVGFFAKGTYLWPE